jgi:peptidoglycan/LPS O-acetylase OafA/YrhL
MPALTQNTAPPTFTKPVTGAPREYPYLDGLRALSMIGVMLFHVRTLTLIPPIDGLNAPLLEWATFWCEPVGYGMSCLIIISGYGSMLSAMRPGKEKLSAGLAYLKRRARRLLIPYYAVMALCLALIAITPRRYLIIAGYGGSARNAFKPLTLISHILLFQNFVPSSYYAINQILWSIAPIFQVYVIFALILLPLYRRIGIKWTVILATLAGYAGLPGHPWMGDIRPYYISFFAWAMGAVLMERDGATELESTRVSRWSGLLSLGFFSTFLGIWVYDLIFIKGQLGFIKPELNQIMLYETLTGLGSVFLLIYLGNRTPSRIKCWISDVLSSRRLKPFALIAYSLLLVHYPVLAATRLLTRLAHMNSWEVLVTMFVVGIGGSFFVAWLFYMAVESNFLSRRLAAVRAQTATS